MAEDQPRRCWNCRGTRLQSLEMPGKEGYEPVTSGNYRCLDCGNTSANARWNWQLDTEDTER